MFPTILIAQSSRISNLLVCVCVLFIYTNVQYSDAFIRNVFVSARHDVPLEKVIILWRVLIFADSLI